MTVNVKQIYSNYKLSDLKVKGYFKYREIMLCTTYRIDLLRQNQK